MTVVADGGRVFSVAPDRTFAQRMRALEVANGIRLARAERKRELKRGDVEVTDLLDRPPAEIASMKVYDLLVATPKVGPVKARTILRRNEVSATKTVGGLSARQRQALLTAMVRYA